MSGDGVGERSTKQLLLLLLAFCASISVQLVPGLCDNPSIGKDGSKLDTHSKSKSNTGLEVLVICLVVAAIVGLSIFLFKLWQRKKREEQHARLLRLFEEDDELELELGLHD